MCKGHTDTVVTVPTQMKSFISVCAPESLFDLWQFAALLCLIFPPVERNDRGTLGWCSYAEDGLVLFLWFVIFQRKTPLQT